MSQINRENATADAVEVNTIHRTEKEDQEKDTIDGGSVLCRTADVKKAVVEGEQVNDDVIVIEEGHVANDVAPSVAVHMNESEARLLDDVPEEDVPVKDEILIDEHDVGKKYGRAIGHKGKGEKEDSNQEGTTADPPFRKFARMSTTGKAIRKHSRVCHGNEEERVIAYLRREGPSSVHGRIADFTCTSMPAADMSTKSDMEIARELVIRSVANGELK